MTKVAIIGTTAWGTTLGIMLTRWGREVWLWGRTEAEAEKLNQARENVGRLPGIPFPEGLRVTASLGEALAGAALVIFAVPSQTMRRNARLAKEHLAASMLILSAAKGLEVQTRKRMSVVLAEELGLQPNISVLSGPNLSGEIIRDLPATTVVAAEDASVAQRVQQIIAFPSFRVYTNTDVIGVELGGALKNIIALSVGMADGLGMGDNAKAALMTRGLAEIARLGVAAGASPLTFAGLSGLGDLVATCSSPLSRNRFLGRELARGWPLAEIRASMMGIAEGVETTVAACQMARGFGVEMPIAEQVHRVLFQGLGVRKAVAELMGRELKHE